LKTIFDNESIGKLIETHRSSRSRSSSSDGVRRRSISIKRPTAAYRDYSRPCCDADDTRHEKTIYQILASLHTLPGLSIEVDSASESDVTTACLTAEKSGSMSCDFQQQSVDTPVTSCSSSSSSDYSESDR